MRKENRMKLALLLLAIFSVNILNITIEVSAKETNSSYKYYEEELKERQDDYLQAYEAGIITKDLYDFVLDFLEEKESSITKKDAWKQYGDFPDEYVSVLIEYADVELDFLGEVIWEESNNLKSVEQIRNSYNADMVFIEQELEIYGIEINLQVTKQEFVKEFPILSAVG